MDSSDRPKQKILFVITKGNWGGAQKYVFDLATSLPADRYTATVAYGEGEELPAQLTKAGVSSVKLPFSKRDISVIRDFILLFSLFNLYRRLKPGIVHLNSSKIGGVGALAARLYNLLVPKAQRLVTIFTAHGWAFNEERPDWQKNLIAASHWLTVILAHRTICVADREYRQMAAWPGTKHKMVVIKNGIGPIHFLTREESRLHLRSLLPPEQRIKTHDYWLGTIAELHKNKGLDFLIEAAAGALTHGQKISTFIIGEGEERSTLEKLIAEKNLTNHVFLVGNQESASQYLKAFDLFVLPSRKEGLPFSLLEAGQAGLPVIASRVGGIPEIITDDTGILVGVGNVRELTLAIEKLVTEADTATNLSHNLKTKIERDFSLEQMITKTEALYQK